MDAEDLKDSSAHVASSTHGWLKRLKLNYGAQNLLLEGYILIKEETRIISKGESLMSEYINPSFLAETMEGFDTAHLGKSFFGF